MSAIEMTIVALAREFAEAHAEWHAALRDEPWADECLSCEGPTTKMITTPKEIRAMCPACANAARVYNVIIRARRRVIRAERALLAACGGRAR